MAQAASHEMLGARVGKQPVVYKSYPCPSGIRACATSYHVRPLRGKPVLCRRVAGGAGHQRSPDHGLRAGAAAERGVVCAPDDVWGIDGGAFPGSHILTVQPRAISLRGAPPLASLLSWTPAPHSPARCTRPQPSAFVHVSFLPSHLLHVFSPTFQDGLLCSYILIGHLLVMPSHFPYAGPAQPPHGGCPPGGEHAHPPCSCWQRRSWGLISCAAGSLPQRCT